MIKKKVNLEGLDLTIYTKTGKLRKRKPKTTRNYFTQETEDAIVAYLKSSDDVERNQLFNSKINNSLHKLAENLIHTFKFYYTDVDNVEHLKHEVVCFLLVKLHKYDPKLGKAYSYFGTVAKHYLTNYNRAQYKYQKDRRGIEDAEEDPNMITAAEESYESFNTSHFLKSYVRYIRENINGIHKDDSGELISFSDKQKDIVTEILTLLSKAEDIPEDGGFYKPAIYEYIRQKTKQKTGDITKVVKIMKAIMKEQMNVYYRNGSLDVEEPDIYIQ